MRVCVAHEESKAFNILAVDPNRRAQRACAAFVRHTRRRRCHIKEV